jgi:N-acetylneuraminate lyase
MKGIFTALLVPYDENGNIKEKELRQVVNYNINEMKIDGLYVGGSTGENFMISTESKKRIFKIVADEALGKTSLIAQVGSLDLQEAVELGKYATELGYECLSAVTPFYYKFDAEEIKDYYETIINGTGNNMLVYCIPHLSGVGISLELLSDLLSNDKVIGVKYTSNDFFLLERLRKKFPNKAIFNGFDELLLSAAVLGVDGAIGSTYNHTGLRARKIFNLAKEGKIDEAREQQHIQNDIISELLNLGLFQGLKEMFKVKGIDAGYCLKPMKKMSDKNIQGIKELVKKYF